MQFSDGQTPLDPDEAAGLIPGLITRAELNEFEQRNILSGLIWARKSRTLRKDLLSISSLASLHARMFDQTWRWAGNFRATGKNIGVEPHQVRPLLVQACDDCKYWIEHGTFSVRDCAVRFHHRLVAIHPFPNGNGRHARMVADLMLFFRNERPLSWGGASLDVEGEVRQRYLSALREADRGRFDALFHFAIE